MAIARKPKPAKQPDEAAVHQLISKGGSIAAPATARRAGDRPRRDPHPEGHAGGDRRRCAAPQARQVYPDGVDSRNAARAAET